VEDNMKYLHILICIVLFFLFSCDNDENPTQYNNDPDDYQLYQMLLIDRYSETNSHIILCDTTGYFSLDSIHISNLKKHIVDLLDETIDNYFTVNVNRKKLKNIPGVEFYTFKSNYQGGYENTIEFGLSDVGYNSAKTQAMISFTERYGFGGAGIIVFFEKEGSDWIISDYYKVIIYG